VIFLYTFKVIDIVFLEHRKKEFAKFARILQSERIPAIKGSTLRNQRRSR